MQLATICPLLEIKFAPAHSALPFTDPIVKFTLPVGASGVNVPVSVAVKVTEVLTVDEFGDAVNARLGANLLTDTVAVPGEFSR